MKSDGFAGSSDDDEFYDRTAASATGAAAAVGPAAKKAKRAAAEAMAPGALFAKAEVLSVHIRELKQAIAEEAALVAAAGAFYRSLRLRASRVSLCNLVQPQIATVLMPT